MIKVLFLVCGLVLFNLRIEESYSVKRTWEERAEDHPKRSLRQRAYGEDPSYLAPASFEQALLYTTARIETNTEAVATGFFYSTHKSEPQTSEIPRFKTGSKEAEKYFLESDVDNNKLLLVTNKHVLFCGPGNPDLPIEYMKIYVHLLTESPPKHQMGMIFLPKSFIEGFTKGKEDYCAIDVSTLFRNFNEKLKPSKISFFPVKQENICKISHGEYPYGEKVQYPLPTEAVVMVGYGNRMWDNVNGYPIIRQGSLSTDPKTNYKGKPEFLINIPSYKGYSGSPVFKIEKSRHEFTTYGSSRKLPENKLITVSFLGLVRGGELDGHLNSFFGGIQKKIKDLSERVEKLESQGNSHEERLDDHEDRLRESEPVVSPASDESQRDQLEMAAVVEGIPIQFSNLMIAVRADELYDELLTRVRDKPTISGVKMYLSDKLENLEKLEVNIEGTLPCGVREVII